ncbi:YycH family regulatory protein [Sporosarcina sp. BP05]|uniref:YycH family regulatory protein n=1 Tax=Sporosarcina sp. BP05 TaxID=2758726 RepID=UPI00164882A3|nr:two-component system activity regulator YycH [Sporosarcina sp. BP05]
MGLKYVETVKSIVLFLLVALSIILTFSIWTYSPRYETIEQFPPVDISIGGKKKIDEIIKPYKVLFNFDDVLKGTTDSDKIDRIMDKITDWKIADITPVDENFTTEDISTFLRKPNRFTVFFQSEIPLSVYDSVLTIEEPTPEISFNQIVVEWKPDNNAMTVYFVSKVNKKLYSGKVKAEDYQSLDNSILTKGRELQEYKEVKPDSSSYLVVSAEPVETIKYTFLEDEVPINKFRDALFSDANAVRNSQVGIHHEELADDHALMNVYTEKKTFKYVSPSADSRELAIPSELLINTINFVNVHGGWTDEFRFTYMDAKTRFVRFRLYLNGLPVYTDSSSSAEILQKWGKNRIYSYARPYYRLNSQYPAKTEVELLPPGTDIAERLRKSDMLDLDAVEEITPGYFMKYKPGLFIMEPAWFYLINGNWSRFSPEGLGGELIGLE